MGVLCTIHRWTCGLLLLAILVLRLLTPLCLNGIRLVLLFANPQYMLLVNGKYQDLIHFLLKSRYLLMLKQWRQNCQRLWNNRVEQTRKRVRMERTFQMWQTLDMFYTPWWLSLCCERWRWQYCWKIQCSYWSLGSGRWNKVRLHSISQSQRMQIYFYKGSLQKKNLDIWWQCPN